MSDALTTEQGSLAAVRGLVEEMLAGTPHFLVDLAVRRASNTYAVDVFIDNDEGITISTLEQLSRDLGFLIDTEGLFSGSYRLTVSSPGLDKPLKLPRQYRKNIGRMLRIQHHPAGTEGLVEVIGTLAAVDDEGVAITLADETSLHIGFGEIAMAKIKLPW